MLNKNATYTILHVPDLLVNCTLRGRLDLTLIIRTDNQTKGEIIQNKNGSWVH